MKQDFLDFNHYEEALWNDPIIRFIDTILRGMAQILFCYHPISGLFFIVGTFVLSPEAGFYSLLGLIVATLTARILKYNPYFIHIGLYGYNAALLGIYWVFFDGITPSLVTLFIATCILSVWVEHLFLTKLSASRWALPAISLPSLISMWIAISVAYLFKLFSFPIPIDKLEITTINFFVNPDYELMGTFLWNHLGGMTLFMLGILFNSRISFLFTSLSFAMSILIALFLGGNAIASWNDIFYNLIPMSIALGGFFFVFNKKMILYTILSMMVCTVFLYHLHNFFQAYGFPVFIYPFNIIVITLLASCSRGMRMEKIFSLYRVPLIVCKRPESTLQWHQEKMESYHYWRNLDSQIRKVSL